MSNEKYNLNEETLNFIRHFEQTVETGRVYTSRELGERFEKSHFYREVVKSYYATAVQKSIWWAVKRSGNWTMERGKYTKL